MSSFALGIGGAGGGGGRRWRSRAAGATFAALVLVPALLGQPGDQAFLAIAVVAMLSGAVLVGWRVHPASVVVGGLLLAVFSGNWSEMGFPSFFAPDRLLLALAIVGVLAPTPALGRREPIRLTATHGVMAAAGAFAVCSALAAGTLISGGYLLLDRFGLVAFLVFVVAPYAFRDERHRTALLWALTGLGVYLALTAVFEILGPRSLVVPSYINDPHVGIHFGRARGPFVEAATNGMALFTCGAAAAMVGLRRGRRASARLLPGAVVLLCALGLVLTLQRTIWVGAAAAVLIVLASRAPLRRWLVPVALSAAVLVGGAVLVIPGLQHKVAQRGSNQETVWDRENLARTSLAMVVDRPLTGFGWDRFRDESLPYFWQHGDTPLTASGNIAHNALLADGAELGVVGTLLWLLAIGMAVGGALLTRLPSEAVPWRDALLGIAVVVAALVLFTPMTSPFPLVVLLLWAGVVRAQGVPAPRRRP